MKSTYFFPITFCLLLCSLSVHAMDYDNVVENTYDPKITYSPGIFKHAKDGSTTLSTSPKHAQKPYTQKALVYGKNPQALKQEKVLKIIVPGKDGRTRVSQPSDWPHSITTQLSMTFDGQDYGGSGVIVGPHQILTCGHNVYDHDISQWAEKISVYPALNESDAPFGEAKVVKAYTFKGWVNQQDPQRDMALLILNKSIGEYTGWGGLLSLDDGSLAQEKVHVTGYPGDKGLKQMWTMGHTLKTIKPEQFDYEIDTYAGQSGSPIWLNKWGMPMILGVHTLGNQSINSGVRLSNKKFTILLKIMSDNSVRNATLAPAPVPNPSPVTPPPTTTAAPSPMSSSSSSSAITKSSPVISQTAFSFEEWRKGLLSIQEPWAKELLRACTSQKIKKVYLSFACIGNEALLYLKKGNLIDVKSLVFSYNNIGDTGAQALATGNFTALTKLELDKNNIGDPGAQALATGSLAALTNLNLHINAIGCQIACKSYPLNGLNRVQNFTPFEG